MMINIAIIGAENCYTKTQKVKDALFKMNKQHPLNLIVYSGGNLTGIESDVKNVCIDFGIPYKEFNPAYTEWNEYSYYKKEMYGKKYHFTHKFKRYTDMSYQVDTIVFGYDEGSNIPKMYLDFLKQQQNKKRIIFI